MLFFQIYSPRGAPEDSSRWLALRREYHSLEGEMCSTVFYFVCTQKNDTKHVRRVKQVLSLELVYII